MIDTSVFRREFRFFLKQPAMVWLVVAAAGLSAFSVWSGLREVDQQNSTIEKLVEADAADRAEALAKVSDYGSAAYYTFHLTYDAPSELAFSALGERDVFPWKHRIRMLALEGQIYETDAANAELAQTGLFDFAFVLSVLTPLFLIVMLHDIRATERAAGRYELLAVTSKGKQTLWRSRAVVRVSLLSLSIFVPFLVGAVISGVSAQHILLVLFVVFAQLLFWTAICLWASARSSSGPAIASGLLAFWVLTTFVIPSVGDAAIESAISAPEGGDIILAQREAVNDAWDLPKEATMDPFVAVHQEWAAHAEVARPFEWKWYYAFQQVGDQTVEEMSKQRLGAISRRQKLAGWVALLSPASLTQRTLSNLAETDVIAALRYQQQVRNFHASLRAYYYPLLFKNVAFEKNIIDKLPEYKS
ncbi:MAG: DUF3526 domain-containing protein [Kordiimonas sp.]